MRYPEGGQLHFLVVIDSLVQLYIPRGWTTAFPGCYWQFNAMRYPEGVSTKNNTGGYINEECSGVTLRLAFYVRYLLLGTCVWPQMTLKCDQKTKKKNTSLNLICCEVVV